MKRISIISISLLTLCIATFVLPGCKKDKTVSKLVKFSFPVLTLNGDPIIILNHGDAFSDPGASWVDTVTGESGTVTASTPVVTTSDGLFVITYSATNKNGLKASVTRDVAVTGISSAFDISGVYLRSGTSATTNVTKLGRGLFQTDNVGGNSLFDPAVFLIQTDSTILIPDQIFPSSGPASFSQAQITYGPPISISYAIAASGYGSQVRTFVKQ